MARPTIEYNIWYRLVDSKDWHTIKIKYTATTEVTINHLRPGSEYEFMVLAQNSFGDGVFSKPIRYFTKRHCKLDDRYICGLLKSISVSLFQLVTNSKLISINSQSNPLLKSALHKVSNWFAPTKDITMSAGHHQNTATTFYGSTSSSST